MDKIDIDYTCKWWTCACMATCMGIIATHLPMMFHYFMYGNIIRNNE